MFSRLQCPLPILREFWTSEIRLLKLPKDPATPYYLIDPPTYCTFTAFPRSQGAVFLQSQASWNPLYPANLPIQRATPFLIQVPWRIGEWNNMASVPRVKWAHCPLPASLHALKVSVDYIFLSLWKSSRYAWAAAALFWENGAFPSSWCTSWLRGGEKINMSPFKELSEHFSPASSSAWIQQGSWVISSDKITSGPELQIPLTLFWEDSLPSRCCPWKLLVGIASCCMSVQSLLLHRRLLLSTGFSLKALFQLSPRNTDPLLFFSYFIVIKIACLFPTQSCWNFIFLEFNFRFGFIQCNYDLTWHSDFFLILSFECNKHYGLYFCQVWKIWW